MIKRTMIAGLVAFLAGYTTSPALAAHTRGLRAPQSSTSPHLTAEESLLACATKALSPADPWHLRPWQRAGYKAVVAGKYRLTRADVTVFGPWEGQTMATASGARCSLATLACNRLPMGTVVWVYPGHLRRVQDTGAHRNDHVADRHGSEFWCDIWTPSRRWRGLGNEWYVRRSVAVVGKGVAR